MKAQKLTKETISQLGVIPRDFPEFAVGDAVAVSQWITEGSKKRIQVFEGDVIAFHKNGASTTFMVRKIGANSIAIERIYPYYSPIIDSIKIVRKGDVRRAKLYYVRDRIGKKARIKERVMTKEERAVEAEKQKRFLEARQAVVKEAQEQAAAKVAKAEAEKSPKKEATPEKQETPDKDDSKKE
jgi:large subunit ribosomal protein L19